MTQKEIQSKIEKLTKASESKVVPQNMKEQMIKQISILNGMLEKKASEDKEFEELDEFVTDLIKKKSTENKKVGSYDKKSVIKKHTNYKAAKKPKEVLDCEEIIAKWESRKAAAKESNGEYKTKSVFDKVSDKMEVTIKQVIEEIPESKLGSKDTKKQLDIIEDSIENIFDAMQRLLGDRAVSDSKVREALETIKQAIKEAKNK